MIKIRYVGKKTDGERAFHELTGITWMPGDVKEVSEEHAAQMLRHGDVFAQDSGEKVKPSKDTARLNAVSGDQDEVDDHAIAREEAARKKEADAALAAAAAPAPKAEEKAPAAKPAAKKTAAKKSAKK
jgi:hypothetical protein